ncbi:hypothetical protein RGAI101_1540 [Roseobacter sp. GAI101]|nr:hypothetical protein RGAI101_1540 [Roseobacter sp. GAI101]
MNTISLILSQNGGSGVEKNNAHKRRRHGPKLGQRSSCSYNGATADGIDQLTRHFEARTQVPVEVLQASASSTSLLRRYRSRRSWWDEAAHQPGRQL